MNLRKQIYIFFWITGLIIIVIGLNELHSIFSVESHNARSDLAAQRNALNKYAIKTLQQNLHNRLKFGKLNIDQITHDPLVSDQGLIMIHQGEQILPRPVRYLQQTHNPAMEIYQWIRAIDPLDIVLESTKPWEQRLNLLSNFILAIDNGDNEEIRWSFRAIREHRTQGDIEAERDIPFMVAVIDIFIQKSNPSKRMLQGVIRDGSIVEQEHNLHGLQRSLLQHRNRFNRQDFVFLRNRIVELSKYVGVPYSDFVQQCNSQTQIMNIGNINNPAIDVLGNWYVEPIAGEELLGVTINIDEVLHEIHQEMILLGLIRATDTITLENKTREFVELNQINLRINSEIWQKKNSDITELYWLKTSLLTITALLIITIMVLTGVIYYRKNNLLTLKSEFISTVSHEFKTPLAALRLLAETMDRKGVKEEIIHTYPRRIVSTIDELNLLVENILSFNRLSKENWESKFESVNLKESILDVSYEFKQYNQGFQKKSFSLVIDNENFQEINIKADPELIKILFRNLISNSLKYNNSENTSILITNYITDQYIIYYRDNGIGIPVDQRQNVFTEFTRILSKDRSIAGTGLGLSICRKIMTVHKGMIEIVASDHPGTCFKICFPIEHQSHE